MRKLLFFVAVLATFGYGCTSQEPEITSPKVDETSQNIVFTTSSIRTLEEAAVIARDAIGMLPTPDSRSSARTFNITNTKILKNTSPSRGATTDTLMYVFNFDNEQGYAIVAANRNLEPLIAVTEQGYYNPDEPIENPGFADFMARAEAAANREIISDTIKPFRPINPELSQTKVVDETMEKWEITPNYNLRWGQRNPEGLLYDNTYSGCTNTAMAIIMSYYDYPATIELTFNNSNETIALNWSEIKHHVQSINGDTFYDDCPSLYPNNHTIISKLLRQLGELNESFDVIETAETGEVSHSTGTYDYKPISTFEKLGFIVTSGYRAISDDILYEMKNGGYKLLVRGKEKNKRYGHNWVIDGVQYEKIRHSEWVKEYGKDWELIGDYSYRYRKFCHCNWGWNGNNNGWFNINYYINPSVAGSFDGGHIGNNKQYENIGYLLVKR